MAKAKRRDKARAVLRKGEVQRENGTYHYSWTDRKGKRHFVYAKTLVVANERIDPVAAEAFQRLTAFLQEKTKQDENGNAYRRKGVRL